MGGVKRYDHRHAAHAGDLVRDDACPSAAVVDRYVGNRILERRMVLGLSLQQLAGMIGVTYQQAHKYERGLNRITAGRLYDIAHALAVPVGWFFDGIAESSEHPETSPRLRMSLELARNFAAISNEKHQEALSHLARALAAEERLSGLGTAPVAGGQLTGA